MPNSKAASADNLTGGWSCGGTPVLTFGPIRVSYEPGYSDPKVLTMLQGLLDQDGGKIETILGEPALVHGSTEMVPASGVLVAVEGDILISVLSKDGVVSADQLVDIANSIDLNAPLTGAPRAGSPASR
jgi:hypothetical protein